MSFLVKIRFIRMHHECLKEKITYEVICYQVFLFLMSPHLCTFNVKGIVYIINSCHLNISYMINTLGTSTLPEVLLATRKS